MKNSKYGFERIYSTDITNRNDVVLCDVLNVSRHHEIILKFISSSPSKCQYTQGVNLSFDADKKGKILLPNGQSARGVYLWEDTAPKELKINLTSKIGLLNIHNAYRDENHWSGHPQHYSLMYKSGMLIEKVSDNKFIYHCHDVGDPVRFDNLVFSIELLEKDSK